MFCDICRGLIALAETECAFCGCAVSSHVPWRKLRISSRKYCSSPVVLGFCDAPRLNTIRFPFWSGARISPTGLGDEFCECSCAECSTLSRRRREERECSDPACCTVHSEGDDFLRVLEEVQQRHTPREITDDDIAAVHSERDCEDTGKATAHTEDLHLHSSPACSVHPAETETASAASVCALLRRS